MNDQVGDVIGERLARRLGLTRAGVIGDGDVAKRDEAIRAGVGRLWQSTGLIGCALFAGPAQNVGGGGFGAEIGVELCDLGVIAGQEAEFGDLCGNADMLKRSCDGFLRERFEAQRVPTLILNRDVQFFYGNTLEALPPNLRELIWSERDRGYPVSPSAS